MRMSLTAAALFAGASLAAGAALAQSSTDPTAPSATPRPTADYVMTAGQSDLFEIREGQIAEKMGKSARVRAFGREMIADHTKSTHDVVTAARSAGLSPTPPVLSDDQQQMIAQLTAATGADFDRVYVQQQLQSHQMALMVQTAYSQSGDDKKLRNTAAKIVPVVQHHIQELSELMTSQGA